jgi:hypothetical protein
MEISTKIIDYRLKVGMEREFQKTASTGRK